MRKPIKQIVWKRAPNPNTLREKNRLLPEEEAGVRKAMGALKVRYGSWRAVAVALKTDRTTITRVLHIRKRATAAFAVRVARLLNVPVSKVLAGRVPDEGRCPYCLNGLNDHGPRT